MADERTYIKVHDGLPDHPKIDALSDAAFRLLVSCWCWCSRYLTDGRIPAETWGKWGTRKARTELVAAGLAEFVPSGIYMHDYLEHQRSADEVAALRAKRSEAGKAGGKAKAKALALARPVAKQTVKQTPGKHLAESETDSSVAKATGRKSPEAEDESTQTLMAEWLEAHGTRPPKEHVARVGKGVKTLLGEGFDPDVIRASLVTLRVKSLSPGLLSSLVAGEANKGGTSRTSDTVEVAAGWDV